MIPNHSSLLLFISAPMVLLAIPGPAVLYVTSRSIGLGRSTGLVSAPGIGVGTLVHVAAAAAGVGAGAIPAVAATGGATNPLAARPHGTAAPTPRPAEMPHPCHRP